MHTSRDSKVELIPQIEFQSNAEELLKLNRTYKYRIQNIHTEYTNSQREIALSSSVVQDTTLGQTLSGTVEIAWAVLGMT